MARQGIDNRSGFQYFKSISKLGLIFFLALSFFFISGFVVITMLVSSKEKIRVPPLVGRLYLDKHNGLAEAGFRVRLERIFSQEYPQGFILSQSPLPGEVVRVGRRLNLVINQNQNIVPVPKLVGVNIELIEPMLENIPKGSRVYALYKGVVTTVPSDAPKGEVLAQYPPKNANVVPHTPISLLVSDGGGKKGLQSYAPKIKKNVPVYILQRMAYELQKPLKIRLKKTQSYEQNGVVLESKYGKGKSSWEVDVGYFGLQNESIPESRYPHHLVYRNSKKDGVFGKAVTLAQMNDKEGGYLEPMYFSADSEVYPLYQLMRADYAVWDGWQALQKPSTGETEKAPKGAQKIIEDTKEVDFVIPEPKKTFAIGSL